MGKWEKRTYKKSQCILFNSYIEQYEVFSNMHRCSLKVGKWIFNSSEHLFQCLLFSDCPTQQKNIYKAYYPQEAKKIGIYSRKDVGLTTDYSKEIILMRFCLRVKYQQCEEFKKALDQSVLDLVEYAWWGDDWWGAVDVDKELREDLLEGEVLGRNACGRLMMGVRDEAKKGNFPKPILCPYADLKMLGSNLI